MVAKKKVHRFDFKPIAKGRPRMSRRGRVFTPERTKIFEDKVADSWAHEINATFLGPVSVEIELHKDYFVVTIVEYKGDEKNPMRGDIDNYAKSILDGLNKVAYEDDKQVRSLKVWSCNG